MKNSIHSMIVFPVSALNCSKTGSDVRIIHSYEMKNGMHTTLTGLQVWYKDNVIHREDGPAMVDPNGTSHYYLNGRRFQNVTEFAKAVGWTDKQLAEHLLNK